MLAVIFQQCLVVVEIRFQTQILPLKIMRSSVVDLAITQLVRIRQSSQARTIRYLASHSGVVSGHDNSILSGVNSFIGGGAQNTIAATVGTISGGSMNSVSGAYGTVGGGQADTASGVKSTVSGGYSNEASGAKSTVSGGEFNTASGSHSNVPGGFGNVASGGKSYAAGGEANATHDGSLVWSSSSTGAATSSYNPYTVTFRCENGARFYTHASSNIGVELPSGGGAWSALCDANQKNFHGGINTSEILDKVSKLSLHRWSYKAQDDSIQHIGPTAQDFHATFGLGDNNTTISTLDPDGVALAAIQELAKQNEQKDTKIADLEARVKQLEAAILQFGNLINSDKQ